MALVALAMTALIAMDGDWVWGVILFLALAVLLGGCAVGTYFNWRVASLVGFAVVFVILLAGTLVAARSGDMSARVFLIVLLLPLPAMAGIVGTFATARLLQSGEAHRQRSTA
jgi:hypothetical protein